LRSVLVCVSRFKLGFSYIPFSFRSLPSQLSCSSLPPLLANWGLLSTRISYSRHLLAECEVDSAIWFVSDSKKIDKKVQRKKVNKVRRRCDKLHPISAGYISTRVKREHKKTLHQNKSITTSNRLLTRFIL